MSIRSSDKNTYGKKPDSRDDKQYYKQKPKQNIQDKKDILNKLVNMDPDDEKTFQDILKPEEAKAVEKIDDKSIFWAQIMRIILTYTKNNDLATFINAVEILEASLGDDVTKAYKAELIKLGKIRKGRYDEEIKDADGTYVDKMAVITIERKFWLDRYKGIINELMRKGLWSLKGH